MYAIIGGLGFRFSSDSLGQSDISLWDALSLPLPLSLFHNRVRSSQHTSILRQQQLVVFKYIMASSSLELLGVVCSLAAIGVFLAPLGIVQAWLRASSTLAYSPLPYLVAASQCVLWAAYALVTPEREPVFWTNVVGLVLELGYIYVFMKFVPTTDKPEAQKAAGAVAVGTTALLAVVKYLSMGDPARLSSLMGTAAAAVCICMYGAPMSVLATVVKTRNVAPLPIGLISMGAVNTALWVWYGTCFTPADMSIVVPNALGLVLSAGQIAIYMYYKDCRAKDDPDPPGGTTQLTAV